MIALADIGFAVGNAIPAAKLAATEITVPASDGAIEAVVNRLYEIADEKNNGGRI
ncbi:MAG: HAD hydrolase family protein [Christensenellales bacterium]